MRPPSIIRRWNNQKVELIHSFYVLIGAIMFSVSYTYFIVPSGLYSMGLTGIAQLLKAVLTEDCHILFSLEIDIVGILSWIFNIPLLLVGRYVIGRKFILRTLAAICVQSLLMTFMPPPGNPVFDDRMLNCLAGGMLCGCGTGLALREGGSGGGIDIIGMIATRRCPEFGVGKICLCVNAFIFLFTAVRYEAEIAAYSLTYAFIASAVIDKIHSQNINMAVIVISREPHLGKALTAFIGRGVTVWKGRGEYTHRERMIYLLVISQYEWQRLKRFLYEEDPKAFIFTVLSEQIIGKYKRKLEV